MDKAKSWVPHEREHWPFHYATVSAPVFMSHYLGYWVGGLPAMETYTIPAGSTVRVVMASRFGDVGITDRLEDETGYGARVDPGSLTPATLYVHTPDAGGAS